MPMFQFAQDDTTPNTFSPTFNIYGLDGVYVNSGTGTVEDLGDYKITTSDQICSMPDGVYYVEFIQNNGKRHYSLPFTIDTCKRYSLQFYNDCNSNTVIYENGFKHHLYVDDIHRGLTQVEPIQNGIDKKDGTRVITDAKYIPTYSINLVLPNDAIQALYNMYLMDLIVLIDTSTSPQSSIRIENVSINVTGDEGNKAQRVTISFNKSDDLAAEKSRCCSIDDIIGDLCDPGGSNADPTCTSYSVDISENSNMLSIVETNAPTGTYSVVWYKDGNPVGYDLTHTMSGFGKYTARVSNGNCIKSASYTYSNPCTTISVNYTLVGNVINAVGIGGDGNYTFEYFLDPDGDSLPGVSVGAGNAYAASADGYYTIEVTDGNGCTADITFYMDLDPSQTECIHTVAISRSGEVLTGTMSNCIGFNEWNIYLDTGSGEVLIGTTNTHTIAENGLYIFEGICNGCAIREQILILDAAAACVEVKIKEWPADPINVEGDVNVSGSVSIDGCIEQCVPTECMIEGVLEDMFICLDNLGEEVNSVTMTPIVTGATQPLVYCWSTGANTQSITVNPTEETTYTVTITDANGCQVELSATVFIEDLIAAGTAECFAGENAVVNWSGTSKVTYEVYTSSEDCDTYDDDDLTLISTGTDTTGTITLSNLGLTDHLVVRLYPTYENGCYRDVCFDYDVAAGDPGVGESYALCTPCSHAENCDGEYESITYSPLDKVDYVRRQVQVSNNTLTFTIDEVETEIPGFNLKYFGPLTFDISPSNINIVDGLMTNFCDALNSLGIPDMFFYPAWVTCVSGAKVQGMRVRFPECMIWKITASYQSTNGIVIESDGTMTHNVYGTFLPGVHPPCGDYPSGLFSGQYDNSFDYPCD